MGRHAVHSENGGRTVRKAGATPGLIGRVRSLPFKSEGKLLGLYLTVMIWAPV